MSKMKKSWQPTPLERLKQSQEAKGFKATKWDKGILKEITGAFDEDPKKFEWEYKSKVFKFGNPAEPNRFYGMYGMQDSKMSLAIEILKHKNPGLRVHIIDTWGGDYTELHVEGVGNYRFSGTFLASASVGDIASKLEEFISGRGESRVKQVANKTGTDDWTDKWIKENA